MCGRGMDAVVSKRLQVVSTGLLKAVVAEQAVAGMTALATNAAFLAKVAGMNETLAYFTLAVLYLSEIGMVASLCVPAVHDKPFAISALYVVLASALAVETALAVSAGDRCARTKSLFLMMACLKHAVSAACSRRLRVYSGSVGEDSMTDAISSGLRERCSRYKLAPTACIAIVAVVVYTLLCSENPFASAPLSRVIGCAQYARSLAIVSFVAAVGSEDRSRDFGRKKSL